MTLNNQDQIVHSYIQIVCRCGPYSVQAMNYQVNHQDNLKLDARLKSVRRLAVLLMNDVHHDLGDIVDSFAFKEDKSVLDNLPN